VVLSSYLGSTLRYEIEVQGGVALKVDVGTRGTTKFCHPARRYASRFPPRPR